jgi:hypothetical protein
LVHNQTSDLHRLVVTIERQRVAPHTQGLCSTVGMMIFTASIRFSLFISTCSSCCRMG